MDADDQMVALVPALVADGMVSELVDADVAAIVQPSVVREGLDI